MNSTERLLCMVAKYSISNKKKEREINSVFQFQRKTIYFISEAFPIVVVLVYRLSSYV